LTDRRATDADAKIAALEAELAQLKSAAAGSATLARMLPRRTCKDPKCAREFVPINPRAEYHSNACRWRHSKEVVRARARQSKSRRR